MEERWISFRSAVTTKSVMEAVNHEPKSHKPKNNFKWKLKLLNIAGIVYFTIFSVIALLVGMMITLPEIYADSPDVLHSRKLLGWYVFTMMVLNYILIIFSFQRSVVKSTTASLPLFNQEHQKWTFCQSCDHYAPPRAKHCPLCSHCILKRDHHCFFAGCCIGFHNQRFFIVFCFYGTIGAVYSLYAALEYLAINYANFFSSDFYNYLLPWLLMRWIYGDTYFKTVSIVCFSYVCVVTLIACSYFCLCQSFLVFAGQTTYEFVKGVTVYQRPLGENLKSVFGPLWILNFLIPMPWVHNKGNGIDWIVTHETKDR